MLDEQYGLWNLMNEFDAICRKHSLNYYMVGNQLLYAARNESHHGYGVSVAMFDKDWKKFCALKEVEENPEREIESILDGGRMPGCYYRYVAADTLLLDMGCFHAFKKPGICVNVHIFRNNSKSSRLLSKYEQGMSDEFANKKTKASFLYRTVRKIMGEQKCTHYLNRLLQESAAKSSKASVWLREPELGIHKYRKGFWKDSTQISILVPEVEVQPETASDPEYYLEKVYGPEWKDVCPVEHKQTYQVITSTTLSYKIYMKSITEKEMVSDRLLNSLGQYNDLMDHFMELDEIEKTTWQQTMFAAGERVRLYKKYMPVKKRLLALMEEGKTDELEMALKDYLLTIDSYLKYGVVICFDPDIFRLVLELYSLNGQKKKALLLEEGVKPEDLEPICFENQVEV